MSYPITQLEITEENTTIATSTFNPNFIKTVKYSFEINMDDPEDEDNSNLMIFYDVDIVKNVDGYIATIQPKLSALVTDARNGETTAIQKDVKMIAVLMLEHYAKFRSDSNNHIRENLLSKIVVDDDNNTPLIDDIKIAVPTKCYLHVKIINPG